MLTEDWLYAYIKSNPDVAFGSIYRDICFKTFSDDKTLYDAIKSLMVYGIITETKTYDNTFYSISKEFIRNGKIDGILNDSNLY